MPAHDLRQCGLPFFAAHAINIRSLALRCVEWLSWILFAYYRSVLICAKRTYPAEKLSFVNWDCLPMIGNSFQCVRRAGVVGIEHKEKLAACFSYRPVVGNVLAGMILSEETNWKIGNLGPSGNQLRHIIGRTIVNHDPFKIAERLRAQTIECTMDRVRTIICWCKDCEKNLVHLMTIALMTAISFREKTVVPAAPLR